MQKVWKASSNDRYSGNPKDLVDLILDYHHIKDKDKFLKGTIEDLSEFDIADLDKALGIIKSHKEDLIILMTDYDVDGCMSGVVGYKMLSELGYKVEITTNNKFKEGYGLKVENIDRAIDKGAKLIITADNGIAAYEACEYAQGKIDLIITDHHEPIPDKYKIPAKAVLDLKLKENENLAFRELCGCGVLWRILSNLYSDKKEAYKYLGYVAIATVADFVPLIDDNRILVKEGLKLINENPPLAIECFKSLMGIKEDIDEEIIGFQIAPTINAVTRMTGSIGKAIQAFISDDEEVIKSNIAYCINENQLRKQLVLNIMDLMQDDTYINSKNQIIVEKIPYESSLETSGVVGLVAGKIKDLNQKPAIIFAEANNGIMSGSARSVNGFNLFNFLHDLPDDLFINLGGHAMAAGMSIKEENFKKLQEEIYKKSLNFDFKQELNYLIYLKPSEINIELIKALESLKPYGASFEKPVFRVAGKPQRIMTLGKESQHSKMVFSNLDVLAWNMAKKMEEENINEYIDCLGKFSINSFRGVDKVNLTVEDIKRVDFSKRM